MLQCVAVCCSALQCVAARCSALQCVAVSPARYTLSVLQCVAVFCSVLQCNAVSQKKLKNNLSDTPKLPINFGNVFPKARVGGFAQEFPRIRKIKREFPRFGGIIKTEAE